MKKYGGVAGLADATLIASLMLIITIIVEGISGPVIPFTSNLYGENNHYGVLLIRRIAVRFSIWLLVPLILIFLIYPMWFPRIFCVTDPEVLTILPFSLRMTALSFIFSGLNLILINSFVASNKSHIALEGIILRTVVLLIPLIFLFNQFNPAQAPWLANLVAEFGTLIYFVAFRHEGKGLFHVDRENLLYAIGGVRMKLIRR